MRTTAMLLLLSSAALVLTLIAGCDPSQADVCAGSAELEPLDQPEPEAIPLVFAEDWTATDLEHDPLADHQPAEPVCPASAWAAEFGAVEVATGTCNYFSVEQLLADPIEVDDLLRVQLWWQSLIATEPATGHVAVLIDGVLIWDTHIAIPGDSEARSIELRSPIAAPAGATVTLHLHNHGANSWTFAELARLDDVDDGNSDDGTACE